MQMAALFLKLVLCTCILWKADGRENSGTASVGRVERFEAELKQVTDGMRLIQPLKELSLEEAVEGIAGPERSLILAVTSSTYLDMVLNWHASLSRFGHGSKVLFMAEDREAFEFLGQRWPKQVVFSGKGMEHVGASEKNSNFSSPYFMSIVDRKPIYVDKILNMNVSVLFNDMDMVWVQDPFPFFKGDFDIWMMEDGWAYDEGSSRFVDGKPQPAIRGVPAHRVCTCFMMIKPTISSRQLVARWKERVESIAAETGQPVHDQGHFNFVLAVTPPDDIKVGALPVQNFPSGCLFFGTDGCGWQHRRFVEAVGLGGVVVVHNNWVEGHDKKLQRFKDKGLWFLAEETGGGSASE